MTGFFAAIERSVAQRKRLIVLAFSSALKFGPAGKIVSANGTIIANCRGNDASLRSILSISWRFMLELAGKWSRELSPVKRRNRASMSGFKKINPEGY